MLTDNQINQIKGLIKLTLRWFCLLMTLFCNNDKKNMISNVTHYYVAQQSANFFMTKLWNISPKWRILILATEELLVHKIDVEKN